MLLRIAFRNIWLHRVRTLIVGGILCFGTTLLIVGNAVLDAVDTGMSRSIVRSLAGHIQVYSSEAEDDLAIYGQPGGVESDISQMEAFDKVKAALMTLPNVDKVIPMGIGNAIIFGGNAIDRNLEVLRAAVREKDTEGIKNATAHLKQMVAVLEKNLLKLEGIVNPTEADIEGMKAVQAANKEAFWKTFDEDPLPILEYLENKVAPMGARADMFFLSYLGTDPQAFSKAFELFDIMKGELIPKGRRGIMLNKRFVNRFLKNRIAHELDKIKDAITDEGYTIATDSDLKEAVARNVRQYGTLLLDFDPKEAAELKKTLGTFLGQDQPLADMLQSFLDMNDENFMKRHAFFFKEIAPKITLYKYNVGDELVISAVTKRGYPRSVRLKIYGIFQFKSLEKSTIAGVHNLMDLITFRELYGYTTPEQERETKELAKKGGTKEVKKDDVESELFGEDADVVEAEQKGEEGFNEFKGVDLGAHRRAVLKAQQKPYTQDELEAGIALSAAVFLKDPKQMQATQQAIVEIGKREGLKLQTATWLEAAGIIGQFSSTIRLVLNVAIFIIFIVALVIMNNAMVMATMERVREVGTMRAIGAQRSFVLQLFLTESVLMAIVFGALGLTLGSGVVLYLEATGIPAFHNILVFLFAGPSLKPPLLLDHLVLASIVCLIVSVVSTFYPAILATRIQPVVAMQAKE